MMKYPKTSSVISVELPPNLQTELFLLGSNASLELSSVLRDKFPGKRPWIVTDDIIYDIVAKNLFVLLQNDGLNPFPPYIFTSQPCLHADNCHVEELFQAMPENAVPVSVGGGTINDFVKRVSFLKNLRYVCFPTACSVDGYTSAGAALVKNGFKQTLPCPAPLAIVADVSVLEQAPSSMFASGYADLAAKIPAGADWILAESFGIEPIRHDVWNLVQKDLKSWLDHPEKMENIFLGLAATGYAMQWYKESRPASGAEHLFAHVLEMDGVDASHGFKVALGTLLSTAMYEWLFWEESSGKMQNPLSREEHFARIRNLLSSGHYGADAERIAMEKYSPAEKIYEQRETFSRLQKELAPRIKMQLIPFQELRKKFENVGAPVALADLNLSKEHALQAVQIAQLIRKRYTILDLLQELGLLEQAAEYAVNRLA